MNILLAAAPVADYDAVRAGLKGVYASKVLETRTLVARLRKGQQAAERALDMSVNSLKVGRALRAPWPSDDRGRYHAQCA